MRGFCRVMSKIFHYFKTAFDWKTTYPNKVNLLAQKLYPRNYDTVIEQ